MGCVVLFAVASAASGFGDIAVTVPSPKPEQRPLLLNPGSLPEARHMEELSRGLANVRSIVIRETVGAVSPVTQLLAPRDF